MGLGGCSFCVGKIHLLDLKHDFCVSCLGNEELWTAEVPKKIQAELSEQGYESPSTFNINVFLPKCHEVRHFMLRSVLEDRLGGSSAKLCYDMYCDIKSNIKKLIASGLRILTGMRDDVTGHLHINVSITSPEFDRYCSWIWEQLEVWRRFKNFPTNLRTKDAKMFRNIVFKSRSSISGFLSWIRETIFDSRTDIAPELPSNMRKILLETFECVLYKEHSEPTRISVKISCDPIYIAGKYVKNSRTISQSPWLDSDIVKYSVSSLIGDYLIEQFMAEEARFSSAGREDIDVRMLGDGRPCLFEIVNPKKHLHLIDSKDFGGLCREWGRHFTGDVLFDDVLNVKKDLSTKAIKNGEESKLKIYQAIVSISSSASDAEALTDKLNGLNRGNDLPIVLNQKTPIRVLQRRANMIRQKRIYRLHGKLLQPDPNGDTNHRMSLLLCAEAGTYIKEFVHGDYGRTNPSLSSLLSLKYHDSCSMLCLDVLHVDGFDDWPYMAAV